MVSTSERYGFIIPIWKKWWDKFCILNRGGKKIHAHIRGGYAPPKTAEKLFFYVVKPVGEIRGYADFYERVVGDREDLWERYGHESCLGSKDLYYKLVDGHVRVTFIRFKNLREALNPVKLDEILVHLGREKTIPRKGLYISEETGLKLVCMMEGNR